MKRLLVAAAIALPLAPSVRGQTASERGSIIGVTAKSRSVQPGELVVLTITPPARVNRMRVRAFGHDVAAFAASNLDGGAWQALVGIDLEVKPGTYPVTIDVDAGRLRTTYDLVVKPRRFPTRRLTVDESFVNPPPSEQERIEQEARLLGQVWRSPSGERLWTEPFVRPVAEPANSRFGTRSIFNGVPRNPHGGADFLSPSGTPIHAPNAGRIVIARNLYFSGNTVVIDHGLGLFSMLAHLSVIDLREGDRVSPGQIVGRVGATGRVTGAHLHWAVRANGARVDPLAVLALIGKN
jgi:murein DD-endopeptidase MepM/ murein hydrolase activator NlpD